MLVRDKVSDWRCADLEYMSSENLFDWIKCEGGADTLRGRVAISEVREPDAMQGASRVLVLSQIMIHPGRGVLKGDQGHKDLYKTSFISQGK
jgi:hypothetical protein